MDTAQLEERIEERIKASFNPLIHDDSYKEFNLDINIKEDLQLFLDLFSLNIHKVTYSRYVYSMFNSTEINNPEYLKWFIYDMLSRDENYSVLDISYDKFDIDNLVLAYTQQDQDDALLHVYIAYNKKVFSRLFHYSYKDKNLTLSINLEKIVKDLSNDLSFITTQTV